VDPRPSIVATRTRGIARILAVTGGKGGIGKSSVAVALAMALAERGARVGLLDLDLWGPSDHVILGVPRPPLREDGGIVPGTVAGLEFLSIASIVADEPVILRGEEAGSAILELLAVTVWGELDALVVDMPPGFADVMIDAARHLPRAEHLVVTTPSALTAVTTRKTIAVLRRLRLPLLGVVVNMAQPAAEADAGVDAAGDGGADASQGAAPLLGRVALDPTYEAALGDPARLRETALYRDVRRIAAAVTETGRRS
jgi:ATP-binding protein involved in chromosome partitioning